MKKQIKILAGVVFATSILFTGCSKDDPKPTVSVNDFTGSIAENPIMGQSIGNVNATVENGNHTRYGFTPEHTGIGGHLSISSSGELTVSNPGFFDYEQNTSISGFAEVITFDGNDNETRVSFTVTINITDLIETLPAPALSVQQRLDGGETPAQVYNSNNTYLDSLYGKTYLGGLIFYFDIATGDGLAAAPNDQSGSLVWDPNTTGLVATTATSTNVGDGAQNTFIITTSIGAGSYAAKVCGDLVLAGYSGWFLPTLDETGEMKKRLHDNGLGNFQNVQYWTSSELDANSAWSRDFSAPFGQLVATSNTKVIPYAVRAIRAF